MHAFLEIIRREAQQVIGTRQFKGTLVATSYDPKTHSIKGILMPQEVETGWIPIPEPHAGNGYGILAGPNVGTAEDLKGDQFDIEFENGDPNTPIAKQKHFSAVDQPPEVQSGELLVKHQAGGSTLFKADKSIITTHANGGTMAFDADGNHTLSTNGKNVTIDAGSGSQTFKGASHSFTGNMSVNGTVSASGAITPDVPGA